MGGHGGEDGGDTGRLPRRQPGQARRGGQGAVVEGEFLNGIDLSNLSSNPKELSPSISCKTHVYWRNELENR